MNLDWCQWFIIISLLLLPILYELSNTFKYYAKFILYYTLFQLIALVWIPLGLARPRNTDNIWLMRFPINYMRKLFGIGVEIRGEEQLNTDSNYIMVVNHQSSLDMLGVAAFFPRRCTIMGKKELLYAGPCGLCFWLGGIVFINRFGGHEKSQDSLKSIACHLKEKNLSILIFPEGTRNHAGSMLAFKKGAFNLAVESGLPIQPVVFSSYSDFYSNTEKRFSTGKFIITCLPKISTRGLSMDDVPELTEVVRKRMLDSFNQTSLETTQAKLANNVNNATNH